LKLFDNLNIEEREEDSEKEDEEKNGKEKSSGDKILRKSTVIVEDFGDAFTSLAEL
jgi:hypothetical protein